MEEPRSIARNNHFVPKGLLKNWANSEGEILCYRILVPSAEMPVWTAQQASSVAFRRDLYTEVSEGADSDGFEQWCGKIEAPALAAIRKLIDGAQVSPEEWRSVIRLVVLQDLRTPRHLADSMARWNLEIPKLLEESLQKTAHDLVQSRKDAPSPVMSDLPGELEDLVRVEMGPSTDGDPDKVSLGLKMRIDRKFWLFTIRHLMRTVVEVPLNHRWSVVAPCPGEEWPCSDHPVVRLNFRAKGDYDLKGGWGRKGSEVMMPISPQHLLYVQVGVRNAPRFALDAVKTREVQMLLCERADSWIFASQCLDWISVARPRIVDHHAYLRREQFWDEWHSLQTEEG